MPTEKSKRSAGEMIDSYGFESREPVDDGYGNMISGPWTERFVQQAETIFLKGDEQVMASRLEGRQPVMLRLRINKATRSVHTDWRAHDKRRDIYFAIRALAVTPGRDFIEITAEAGVSA
jgi:hypothetical protein